MPKLLRKLLIMFSGGTHVDDSPLTNESNLAEIPEARLHPFLQSQLIALRSAIGDVPTGEAWERFLLEVDDRYAAADRMEEELEEGVRGWSSFENLFRMSPTPTMEQDYTTIREWMAGLRAQGVTDIGPFVQDIESVRAIVPKIRIVAANPAASEAVGLPGHELLGPIDPRIVNDDALVGWQSQLEAVWNDNAESAAEFVAGTPSGRTYDAQSRLSAPLIDGRPDFSRAVFTIVDVTDQRNEERRILSLVEAKSQFLALVSHEIRTPLTAVVGFAQLLDDELGELDADDRRLMVSSIAKHAQDIANLVDDLLIASRAESGQVDISIAPVDVVKQIHETIDAGGSYTEDVRVIAPDQGVRAMADPVRVRQILRNLLTNAERYGGPNVSVEVTTTNGTVFVSVTDDGPGLAPADWDRIFEPYQTAHDSPGRPGSVGIGLAISRQLAELMGGNLDYRHEGRQSIFRLGLVAAPE